MSSYKKLVLKETWAILENKDNTAKKRGKGIIWY